jgi:hypothetical protein
MSIQSKSSCTLAVVSVLALASACGEGTESAEQQESPAQMAPDSLKEQEAASIYYQCSRCMADFWGTNSDGMAGGWICDTGLPTTSFAVTLEKWDGLAYQEIGRGTADAPNDALSSVCGSPYHQFNIYVGSNGGPGEYRIQATSLINTRWGMLYIYSRTFYR